MPELLTEKQVKNMLQIKDFRSISKEQLINFMSSIPDMDKEVAIKCIEQFPDFAKTADSMVTNFYNLCEQTMRDDNKDAIESYKTILDDIRFQLNEDNITEESKHYIIDKMVEVCDKIHECEGEKRTFKEKVLKMSTIFGAFALSVGAAILGVKTIVKKP